MEGRRSSSFLLDGCYKAAGTWYSSIVFDGNTAVMRRANGAANKISFKVGDLGEAAPEITETTGQDVKLNAFICIYSKI